jgi:hypothetical protein
MQATADSKLEVLGPQDGAYAQVGPTGARFMVGPERYGLTMDPAEMEPLIEREGLAPLG